MYVCIFVCVRIFSTDLNLIAFLIFFELRNIQRAFNMCRLSRSHYDSLKQLLFPLILTDSLLPD